jgi:TonB C terminal
MLGYTGNPCWDRCGMLALRSVAIALLAIAVLAGPVHAQDSGPAPTVERLAPKGPPVQAEQISPNEISALITQIRLCWLPPQIATSQGLTVNVSVALNRDGSLKGDPAIENHSDNPAFAALAASVLRALKQCQPFRLPASKYAAWKALEIVFDPIMMAGSGPAPSTPAPGPPKRPAFDPTRIERLLDQRSRPAESK